MPKYTVEAVVLKFTNYRDADKMYTLFTKDRGKISASGKGVRKITSRRGGNLDTLNYVKVGISEGDSKKYRIITEAETLNSFKDLKRSLNNSARGFYIAELVHKMLDEGQVNEDVFDLLVSNLSKLNTHLNNEVSRVNKFEVKLMELLGYSMYLDRCVRTDKIYDGSWNKIYFNPNLGGFVSDSTVGGFEINKDVADLLYALKTKDRINKKLLKDPNVVREADRLIKLFIKSVLEDNFNTQRVFGEV